MKKEENLELIKKLENQTIDTSLLRSSKKLGRGNESKREALGRVLRERRAGIDGEDAEDILFEERSPRQLSNLEEERSSFEELAPQQASLSTSEAPKPTKTFGGGLKRPLEVDDSGKPIIKTRKRVKTTVLPTSWQVLPPSPPTEDSEWSGFSTNSDNDESVDTGSDENETSDESSAYATDEDGEAEVSDIDNAGENKEELQERKSAFTAWASQQRNEAIGFQPSSNLNTTSQPSNQAIPQDTLTGSMKPQISQPQLPHKTISTIPTTHTILVNRPAHIQTERENLPIVTSEQQIMESITNNPITIITASTGSGKTTQVPQFLFEAGYGAPGSPFPGMIGVTQPRRVAAVSVAARVSTELGETQVEQSTNDHAPKPISKHVAHQVRFETTVSKSTRVKFMTDGILLREASTDFTLSAYAAIILDEVHERSLNTDILLGLLTRIVATRLNLAEKYPDKYKPLKLIVMSASLKASDFTNNETLWKGGVPPIVEVEGRQYPVQVHWAKKTERDYVEEAYRKIQKAIRSCREGEC